MTPVRTGAGLGLGTVLLTVLSGCSSGSSGAALAGAAPISAPASSTVTTAVAKGTSGPGTSLFASSKPVSVVTWWKSHPETAPSDLADRTLLFNRSGSGPQRFPGPDLSKFDQVVMIITCAGAAQYSLRLQVLDGLSIATTSGDSCGGPEVSSYQSPATLKVGSQKTEIQVDVPDTAKYYVTVYGKAQ